MKKKLKLYVWESALNDYTDGIMFALATSPAHARELLRKKDNYIPKWELAKKPKVISRAVGFVIWGGS